MPNHTVWFQEQFELNQGRSMTVAIKDKIVDHQSKFQHIEVFETVPFGRMLVLDGVIMLTQADNFAYHEMIVHVPMQAHPDPRKALVIGGGDGGTLKEMLKYRGLKKATICEIDGDVIEVCKVTFPELAAAYEDPRVEVVVGDGAAYVKSNSNQFDVICVDSSDPIGPAEILFQKPFYQDLHKTLTDDGIAVTQSESMYYHTDFIQALLRQNQQIFEQTAYYFTVIPTYPSGTIGFSFCSKKYDPIENLRSERMQKLDDLSYYNHDIHQASFCLPQFLINKLERQHG